MDSSLKQRLIGAAVLVALAVIFLPMLVQGPAPNSGVSDVPLTMPDAPQGEYQTRDLPLVTPGSTPNGGAVGLDTVAERGALPTVDTAVPPPSASQPVPLADTAAAAPAALPAEPATNPTPATAKVPLPAPTTAKPEAMLPAATAGGDYAVHFGSYATAANAETIVRQLRAAQMTAYSEPSTLNGKQVYRVRIGPYATRADAEAGRLRAARVRNDVQARVIALDAETTASAATGAAKPASNAIQSEPLPAMPIAAKPTTTTTANPTTPSKPASNAATVKPSTPTAAAGVGFAVQLGAFSKAADATAVRDRVRAAGFNAFTDTVNTDKGALTRVRAGPVVGRAEAEQLRLQVKAKVGIDGIVRPHP